MLTIYVYRRHWTLLESIPKSPSRSWRQNCKLFIYTVNFIEGPDTEILKIKIIYFNRASIMCFWFTFNFFTVFIVFILSSWNLEALWSRFALVSLLSGTAGRPKATRDWFQGWIKLRNWRWCLGGWEGWCFDETIVLQGATPPTTKFSLFALLQRSTLSQTAQQL